LISKAVTLSPELKKKADKRKEAKEN